jgi:transcription elongation factor Elf1
MTKRAALLNRCAPCPRCGVSNVGYAPMRPDDPMAGKDPSRAWCYKCGAQFNITTPDSNKKPK